MRRPSRTSCWNAAARRSGGYRPTQIPVAGIDPDTLFILKQAREVFGESGQEGLDLYWYGLRKILETGNPDAKPEELDQSIQSTKDLFAATYPGIGGRRV